MVFGKLIKNIFGGADGAAKEGELVTYQGYEIIPAPLAQNGQYLTAGTIRKTIDGELKEHRFIRADTSGSFDDACGFTVTKAQQLIDQMGDRLFNERSG